MAGKCARAILTPQNANASGTKAFYDSTASSSAMSQVTNGSGNPGAGGGPGASGGVGVIDSGVNATNGFIDSINGVTKKIRNINCTKTLVDFFDDATGADSRKAYDWVSENVNLQTGMKKLADLLDKASPDSFNPSKIGSSICTTLSGIVRTLIAYLEKYLKFVIALFKKIDELKSKVEQALLDFTASISDCIVSTIINARNALNNLINNITDFSILEKVMGDCDCIMKAFQAIFGCEKDSNGNKITQPAQVVTCIQDKFHLNPATILGPINDFINNVLLDSIQKGFNAMDDMIKWMMDLLITPLRELVKAYCDILNYKINVTFLIRLAGPLKCFLVYTEEMDDSGKYYGMSVLDILETLKVIAGCTETLCSAVSDNVGNKIKKYNEELRLNIKYWNLPMVTDIYQSCIAVKNTSQKTRPTAIRELFYMARGKGKDVFTGIIDTAKEVGKIPVDTTISTANTGKVADSIRYANGPDTETTPVGQGTIKFYEGVEDLVMSVIRTLKSNISDGAMYERFIMFATWDLKFNKSQSHINEIMDTYRKYSDSSMTTQSNPKNMVEFTHEVPDTINTFSGSYVIDNDYNQSEIDKIINTKPPLRNVNESKSIYYKNWFEAVTA